MIMNVVEDRVVGAKVVGADLEGDCMAGFGVEVGSLLGALCGSRWSLWSQSCWSMP
jgi:hypothetical protein